MQPLTGNGDVSKYLQNCFCFVVVVVFLFLFFFCRDDFVESVGNKPYSKLGFMIVVSFTSVIGSLYERERNDIAVLGGQCSWIIKILLVGGDNIVGNV